MTATFEYSLAQWETYLATGAKIGGWQYAKGIVDGSLTTLNPAQSAQLTQAASLWEDVANVDWVRVDDNLGRAQSASHYQSFDVFTGNHYGIELSNTWVRFAVGDLLDDPGTRTGGATYSGGLHGYYKEIYIDNATNAASSFDYGSGSFHALLHEMGHAMAPYGAFPNNDHIDNDAAGNPVGVTQTIMNTYHDSFSAVALNPSTPMSLDIDRMVALYGANTSTRTGDDTYGFHARFSGDYRGALDFSVNKTPLVTIFDDGGTDTLDASLFYNADGFTPRSVQIDLNPGATSFVAGTPFAVIYRSALAGAAPTIIENAIGGYADDVLLGNDAGNYLDGNAGADRIEGGKGNDTYVVDNIRDIVVEKPGEGTDAVISWLDSYKLPDNIENLTYRGTGNFQGVGNDQNNVIKGGGGDDYLIGSRGSDVLDGGVGLNTADYSLLTGSVLLQFAGGTAYAAKYNAQNASAAAMQNLNFDGGDELLHIQRVYGTSGDDGFVFSAGAGDIIVDAGAGVNDTATFSRTFDQYGISVSGGATTVKSVDGTQTLTGIEHLVFADITKDVAPGGGVVVKAPVSNFVGTDQVDAIAVTASMVTVKAAAGDDIITMPAGSGIHALSIDGGTGFDTLDLSGLTSAFTVNLAKGSASGSQLGPVSLIGIESIIGGSGSDTIVGSNGNDRIEGNAGNDTLTGGKGNDTFVFHAGFGKDKITDFQIGSSSSHDTLDLRGLGFKSAADVLSHTDHSANAVIHIGTSDTITLQGVSFAQLQAHTFDFLLA
jgi:Ca2+-binding RTX toxin-like protein